MTPDLHEVSGPGVPPQLGSAPGSIVSASFVTPTDPPAQPLNVPMASNDLDQDWIDKAKEVVEQTKGDPFVQSNELQKVRAEFLRVRYNKQINTSEDQP